MLSINTNPKTLITSWVNTFFTSFKCFDDKYKEFTIQKELDCIVSLELMNTISEISAKSLNLTTHNCFCLKKA